ncbi:MAG TPA: type II toxin-antitoxin system HicA family toxin [Thermoanaerobaculia bacterium]|nr:type II toxin-antitoxin system HicA family toxin [Thermoanaerobaculia bacterium]
MACSCLGARLTYRELTRHLQRRGCQLARQSKGSHEIWHNPAQNRSTAIPRHSGDIPPGTLRAILKGLGISPDDLISR